MSNQKPRSARPRTVPPRAYKPIEAALKQYQEPAKPKTPEEVFASNGIPPAPAAVVRIVEPPLAKEETWSEAFRALVKIGQRGLELIGEALIEVGSLVVIAPLTYAMASVVYVLAVWEFWGIAKPLADAAAARIISGL